MGSSPVSRRSSTLFGIHSESKKMEQINRVRSQNRRFSLIAAAVIFSIVFVLMCIMLYDLYNSSAVVLGQNGTRQVSVPHMEHLGDLIAAEHWKVVEDIHLGPPAGIKRSDEGETEHIEEEEPEEMKIESSGDGPDKNEGEDLYEGKKEPEEGSLDLKLEVTPILGRKKAEEGKEGVDLPPNHRFDEEKPVIIEERVGWRPRPFTLDLGEKRPSSIQDILNRPVPTLPRGFSPPVRFKGVYVRPKMTPLEAMGAMNGERNEDYYRKVNALFTRQKKLQDYKNIAVPSEYDEPIDDASDHKAQKSELYTKVILPPTPPDSGSENSKNWNRKNTNTKKKPFTVMLDIYPMDKDEDGAEKSPQKRPPRKPKNAIYIPMRPNEEYFKPDLGGMRYIPQVMVPPKQRRKNSRMLMKLNLFPKKGEFPDQKRRIWGMFGRQEEGEDGDYDDDDDDVEEEEGCKGVIGHNPYGKPITAKWKDKNGEMIHAKFVSLQKWKDRMDEDINPR